MNALLNWAPLIIVVLFLVVMTVAMVHSENKSSGESLGNNDEAEVEGEGIIVCIATFIAKNGKAKELLGALNYLVEPTRKEQGCLSYALYQSLNNSNMFTMIEKFKNKDALNFHGEQPYLQVFKTESIKLVESSTVVLYKKF